MTAVAGVPRATRPRSGGGILRALIVNPGAFIGAIILTALVIGAVFAPLLAPFELHATDTGPRLSPPSATNFLGTDLHGRDIFSRVLYGGRYSLSVGVATVLFAAVIGSLFGVFIGFVGGRVDAVGSRVIDVMFGFPSIVLSILIVAVLGVGLVNVVIAVGIAEIPHFARVVRGAALAAKEQPVRRSVAGARRQRSAYHSAPRHTEPFTER